MGFGGDEWWSLGGGGGGGEWGSMGTSGDGNTV